ncbi:sigma factor-like helix-turn-helix DNA-binding protein [Nocardiopsis sp. FIRDI 009]|uniref:sigma factor-like helix-turn-helix DNA-binding protein n=1 Tax=Nocardiopsis sp. FIRDI 009 TaxID=714197 RepID=UPI000E26A17C|nr:sigma factor-like helix-turn-helix DNA-binding protein [Nocardiopsis sp. FIRDI 009]
MEITDILTDLRALPTRIESEADPMTRARLVGETLAAFAEIEAALKEVRRPAVVELRGQGLTLRAIGEELGLSASRVDQISRGLSG